MESKRIRFRMCEVCERNEFLNEDKIKEALMTLSDKVIKYCYILHDKDKLNDNTLKSAHYHIFLQFKDMVDFSVVAKAFGIENNYIKKIMAKNYAQAIPYLVHANAPDKFQYNVEEVKANFDYKKVIENYKNKANGIKRIDVIKEQIESGIIREYNVNDYVTMEEYAKYKTIIERCLEYQRANMAKKNIQKEVIFITGEAGCGKTTFAKDFAKKQGLSYFVSGSSNDPFDSYRGEDVVILDDLRGSVFSLSDLLKILDNNTNSLVKSRYFNKVLDCKYIIITSVLELEEFYNNVFENNNEPILQFKRRCSTYIKMDKSCIEVYNYNKDICDYELLNVFQNSNVNLKAREEDKKTSKKVMEFLDSMRCYEDENENLEEYYSNYDDSTFYDILDLITKKENMTRIPLQTPSENILTEMIDYADDQLFLNKVMEYEEVKD